MENPGQATGVGRIEEARTTSLRYPSSPELVNPSSNYYWYTWPRTQYIVEVVKSRGVQNAGEWKRLARICKMVIRRKKVYLYREFRPLFSQASLEYLFGPDFYPLPWEVQ